MADDKLGAYNIFDLRDAAKRRLPKWIFEFVDRGAEDDEAVRNNLAAFKRIKLKPRVLVDVSKRSQGIELFGKPQTMPIAIAPTGAAGVLWYEGEIALARAARAAGVPFSLSTASQTPMERVAEEAGGTLWFQLYMRPDRSLSHQLVKRAHAAGYEGLIVTVDGPVAPNREYNVRNGFSIPFKYGVKNTSAVLMHPRWLCGVLLRYLLTTGMPTRANEPTATKGKITQAPGATGKTDTLTWEDLKVLRAMWPGKLMVKGILHPKDAILAADCGADAVIVSNHGGRYVDSSMAPVDVLPDIVDAVGHRVTVIVDGGVRRGSDVIKALARGAKAVLVGRATLYGTAVVGQAGAERALAILREEIDRMMALVGARSVSELDREFLEVLRAQG